MSWKWLSILQENWVYPDQMQQQEVFYKNCVPKKFAKFTANSQNNSVGVSFLVKWKLVFFLWILQNFSDHVFCRTPLGDYVRLTFSDDPEIKLPHLSIQQYRKLSPNETDVLEEVEESHFYYTDHRPVSLIECGHIAFWKMHH